MIRDVPFNDTRAMQRVHVHSFVENLVYEGRTGLSYPCGQGNLRIKTMCHEKVKVFWLFLVHSFKEDQY